MREIKFRGRRVDNGEWVFGHYFTTPLTDENSGAPPEAGWFFLTGETRHCISRDGVVYVVDPATISRFIGLRDKHGVEIYEGDVVLAKCAPSGKDRRYIKSRKCEVLWSNMGMPGWDVRILDYEPGVKWSRSHLYLGRDGNALEVIGNVWENPDLLKGGGKDG